MPEKKYLMPFRIYDISIWAKTLGTELTIDSKLHEQNLLTMFQLLIGGLMGAFSLEKMYAQHGTSVIEYLGEYINDYYGIHISVMFSDNIYFNLTADNERITRDKLLEIVILHQTSAKKQNIMTEQSEFAKAFLNRALESRDVWVMSLIVSPRVLRILRGTYTTHRGETTLIKLPFDKKSIDKADLNLKQTMPCQDSKYEEFSGVRLFKLAVMLICGLADVVQLYEFSGLQPIMDIDDKMGAIYQISFIELLIHGIDVDISEDIGAGSEVKLLSMFDMNKSRWFTDDEQEVAGEILNFLMTADSHNAVSLPETLLHAISTRYDDEPIRYGSELDEDSDRDDGDIANWGETTSQGEYDEVPEEENDDGNYVVFEDTITDEMRQARRSLGSFLDQRLIASGKRMLKKRSPDKPGYVNISDVLMRTLNRTFDLGLDIEKVRAKALQEVKGLSLSEEEFNDFVQISESFGQLYNETMEFITANKSLDAAERVDIAMLTPNQRYVIQAYYITKKKNTVDKSERKAKKRRGRWGIFDGANVDQWKLNRRLKQDEKDRENKGAEQIEELITERGEQSKIKEHMDEMSTDQKKIFNRMSENVIYNKLPASISGISMVIVDLSNATQRMDFDKLSLNRLGLILSSYGITMIVVEDKPNSMPEIDVVHYRLTCKQTDDMLMVALSQYLVAPILSRDFYRDFVKKTMICTKHNRVLWRTNEQCPEYDQLECTMRSLWNERLSWSTICKQTGKWNKNKSDIMIGTVSYTTQTSELKYGGPIERKIRYIPLPDRGDVDLRVTIMGVGTIKAPCTLSRLIVRGESYAVLSYVSNMAVTHPDIFAIDSLIPVLVNRATKINEEVLMLEIHEGVICVSIKDSGEYTPIDAGCIDDVIASIIGTMHIQDKSYTMPVVSSEIMKDRRSRVSYAFICWTDKLINTKITHGEKTIAESLVIMLTNGRATMMQMGRRLHNMILGQTMDAVTTEESRERLREISCMPFNEEIRDEVVSSNLYKSPDLARGNKSGFTGWQVSDQDQNTGLVAQTKRFTLGIISDDRAILDATLNLFAVSNKSMINVVEQTEHESKIDSIGIIGSKDRVKLFKNHIDKFMAIQEANAKVMYPLIMPSSEMENEDDIVVNYTHYEHTIMSKKDGKNARANVADLTKVMLYAVKQTINDVIGTFKKVMEHHSSGLHMCFMRGYDIDDKHVNKDAKFPVHITYYTPYAYVLSYIFRTNEGCRAYYMVAPKAGILSAVASMLLNQEASLIQVYNEDFSSAMEEQAMDAFFGIEHEGEMLDMDYLNEFSVYYAIMAPAFIKLGQNAMAKMVDVILNIVLSKADITPIARRLTEEEDAYSYVAALLTGRNAFKNVDMTLCTEQMRHDIIKMLKAAPEGKKKRVALTWAILSIPRMMDPKYMYEHLSLCFGLTKKTENILDMLHNAKKPEETKGQTCKMWMTSPARSERITGVRITDTGFSILSETRSARIDISEGQFKVTEIIRASETACTVAVTNDKAILVQMKLVKDTTNRMRGTKYNINSYKKAGMYYEITFTYEEIKAGDAIINELENLISRAKEAGARKIIIVCSDKLPSMIKASKGMSSRVFVDYLYQFYMEDHILFASLRSVLVRKGENTTNSRQQKKVRFEEVEEKIDTMATGTPRFFKGPPAETYAAMQVWVSKHRREIVLFLLVVVVAWVFYTWFVQVWYYPTKLLTLVFGKTQSTYFGVAKSHIPSWLTYAGQTLSACLLAASAYLGLTAYKKK